MKQILLITTLFILFSCSDNRISDYKKIINQIDYIKIEFKALDETIELNNEELLKFKEILIRNIELVAQQEIEVDSKVDLYSDEEKIGSLMIDNNPEMPIVNFSSDKLNFSFRLTYGIGMYLNDIKE